MAATENRCAWIPPIAPNRRQYPAFRRLGTSNAGRATAERGGKVKNARMTKWRRYFISSTQ
jgi:hypothetical protein